MSFHTDVIMYDVDDHCYGKKLVRRCPMTSLFQALRWYMIVMHRDLENRFKKRTGTGDRETQALDLVCAASLLYESLAQDTHH